MSKCWLYQQEGGQPIPQDTAGFHGHSLQGISGREEGGLQSVGLRVGGGTHQSLTTMSGRNLSSSSSQ